MSHRIVEIDELARLVIDELVRTSPRTAVSFALTCRSLEEPTLSSLWKKNHSLIDLVRVLPNHTCHLESGDSVKVIVSGCDLPGDRIRNT